MTKIDFDKLTRELKGKGPTRRSDLYKTLLTKHARLSPLLDQPEPNWGAAAALLAEQGVLGATGQPPSPQSLRKMWLRVSRDVERLNARKATRSNQPARSRPQTNWAPTPVAPRPAARPPEQRQPAPSPPAPVRERRSGEVPEPPADFDEHAREQWFRAQEMFAEHDRKKFGAF